MELAQANAEIWHKLTISKFRRVKQSAIKWQEVAWLSAEFDTLVNLTILRREGLR